MATDDLCITFLASLPPIQSAITLDGNGDGARIKFDLPASDVGAALLLQHHGAGRVLRVTVQVEGNTDAERTKTGRL